MSTRPIILWINKQQIGFIPIWLSQFEPVAIWDSEQNRYTDEQMCTSEGVPIFQASAMARQGFRGDLSPIKIRIATDDIPPKVQLISEQLEALNAAD